MKLARRKRANGIGTLILIAGMVLLLAPHAGASPADTGLTLMVQNALASSILGAGGGRAKVDIPDKAVCRSPFKPPSWVPGVVPAWAPGQAKKLAAEPPWKKLTQAKPQSKPNKK